MVLRAKLPSVFGIKDQLSPCEKLNWITKSDGKSKPAESCVFTVALSEGAKVGVATYSFYADVYEHPKRDAPDHLTVEHFPIF